MYGDWLCLARWTLGDLRVTQSAYLSLLTDTKKLLLMTFHETTAEIGVSFQTHRTWKQNTDRQTKEQKDLKVEIFI